jgi:hypothetical protein
LASDAQIGHGGRGSFAFIVGGDVYAIAGNDFLMHGVDSANAQVGHGGLFSEALVRLGDVIVASDQLDPLSDGGGRLYMNRNSRIDAGGQGVGRVLIFGTRRLGNQIEDGAWINGVTFNSSLPPATLTGPGGEWNTNFEFFNWDHEQWGFTLSDLFSDPSFPYSGPFTFYFLGPAFDTDLLAAFCNPHDCFERYALWAQTFMKLFPNGPYYMDYNGAAVQPWDEQTGWTSPELFTP